MATDTIITDGIERQKPIKNKKKLLLIVAVAALFAPLPIFATEYLLKATGKTEADYLASLPPIVRKDMHAGIAAHEQDMLAHFRAVSTKSEEEIGRDKLAAYYMTQILIRDLIGHTKIVRFDPFERIEITRREPYGWDITGTINRWGKRDYVDARFEATITYRGDGWWKLDRLNIPGKSGVLRFGVGMPMPTGDSIPFNQDLFEQRREQPEIGGTQG